MATNDIPGPEDNPACYCPMTGIMETLANKYAMQIICAVGAYDRARFSEIQSSIPDASTSTLSARLDELESEGLVTRDQYNEVPPRVKYELTDDGRELSVRLLPLLAWVGDREGVTDTGDLADVDGGFDLGDLVDELRDLLDRD